jgi:hypothetical protein
MNTCIIHSYDNTIVHISEKVFHLNCILESRDWTEMLEVSNKSVLTRGIMECTNDMSLFSSVFMYRTIRVSEWYELKTGWVRYGDVRRKLDWNMLPSLRLQLPATYNKMFSWNAAWSSKQYTHSCIGFCDHSVTQVVRHCHLTVEGGFSYRAVHMELVDKIAVGQGFLWLCRFSFTRHSTMPHTHLLSTSSPEVDTGVSLEAGLPYSRLQKETPQVWLTVPFQIVLFHFPFKYGSDDMQYVT